MFRFKTVCLFVIVALFAFSASAQEFKPFKVNLSLGYAQPTGGGGASGGILFSAEPKYSLTDAIEVGLRGEAAIVVQGLTINGTSLGTNTASAKALVSYVLTGNYYFTTSNFRPYVGLGAGLYSVGGGDLKVSTGTATANGTLPSESKFGFMVRAGVKLGHLNAGAEYNLVGSSKTTSGSATVESTNSYVGIKLGVDIEGGRR